MYPACLLNFESYANYSYIVAGYGKIENEDYQIPNSYNRVDEVIGYVDRYLLPLGSEYKYNEQVVEIKNQVYKPHVLVMKQQELCKDGNGY